VGKKEKKKKEIGRTVEIYLPSHEAVWEKLGVGERGWWMSDDFQPFRQPQPLC
jgi:hypothetical protein